MDVPTRLQGSLCESGCRHLFRRAKIAFDAGAPKIAQRRVDDGLNAINNCRAFDPQWQVRPSRGEETPRNAAREIAGEAKPAAAPGESDRFAEFIALFGRMLEAEQRRTDPELAAYRLALLVEIGDVGGVVKP
jgi:hypothetical protein